MEDTLRVINELEAENVIGRYAIGGAIGILFYTEPAYTEDLDIFCQLPKSGGLIDTGVSQIYEWLRNRGYTPKHEHVVIEGIPVQFLPAMSELVEEAIDQAVDDHYGTVQTRVFQYEHLLAIAASVGRPKDKERIAVALESRRPDEAKLIDILRRHNLLDKWSEITS